MDSWLLLGSYTVGRDGIWPAGREGYYSVFCKWMNDKKRGAKRINARAMKDMEHFANHWEEGKMN